MHEWMTDWGPIISATIGGIFTLIGAYMQISKPGKPKPIMALLSLVFIIIAIGTTLILWEPKSQWDLWSERIEDSINSCTKKGDSDVTCVQKTLEQNVKLMPQVDYTNDPAAKFYHDIKAGEMLMNIEVVRDVFKK